MRKSPTPLLRPLMLAAALALAAVAGLGSAGDLPGFAPPATGLLVVLALGVAWRRAERRAAAGQRARDAMVGTARDIAAWQAEAGRRFAGNVMEYAVEERRLVVSRTEFEAFAASVAKLRDDLARLEQRIERHAASKGA